MTGIATGIGEGEDGVGTRETEEMVASESGRERETGGEEDGTGTVTGVPQCQGGTMAVGRGEEL